jgi:hypothetical protein
MPEFVPGLELCGAFYGEVVRPLLGRIAPGLPHSAALIGEGSEVLRLDTPMSTDHDWGPRVMLFLEPEHLATHGDAIREELRRLPRTFRGYPTSFTAPDPAVGGNPAMDFADSGLVNHRVDLRTLAGWLSDYLGFDARAVPTPTDWLTFPEQKLLGITRGAVYHDDLCLGALRDRFAYYPDDVWLYLLASGWARIAQEEHLMGCAGFVGDETGSALIGARLVRDIMRLCFLMERTYAPYAKWFGSAFARLGCGEAVGVPLRDAMRADGWQEREAHLCAAYEQVARMHNELRITEPIDCRVRPFHDRPFQVIGGGRFAEPILRRITDPEAKRLAGRRPIGSIDQFSDSTDLACCAELRPALLSLYADPGR